MRLLLLLGLFFGIFFDFGKSSFCGENGVPFSLEILPNGAPVLGCAQPSCVAQPTEDVDDSVFQNDAAGQPDGFFRQGDRTNHGFLQTNKLRANCSADYDHLTCGKKNQWVGGIDFIDHPRQPLLLRCCTFDGLRYSQDVGVTTIGPGETVTGGEVIRENRQISFDIISNVRKLVDEDDNRLVSYEVTVRRMNCLPDPPEIEVPLDDDVPDEVLRVLEKSSGSMPVQETTTEAPRKMKNFFKQQKRKSHEAAGTFGATIFTPDGPSREKRPEPRRILPTISPPSTTAAPMTPVVVPIVPTTPPPATAAPVTMALLPTLPTMAPFAFGQPFFFQQPSFPARPLSQAYGVSQANLAPLAPPSQYQLPAMFPTQQQPAYNPFALPQQQPFGVVAQPGYGVTPAPNHFNFFAPMQITPAPVLPQQNLPQHMFSHFGLPQQSQVVQPFGFPQQQPFQQLQQVQQTDALNQPSRKPLVEEKPSLPSPNRVEPQIPPTNRQLGSLFQPPQFSAIDAALQNFRLQG